MAHSDKRIPSSVLIIGSGVFGLSTAYSLALNDVFRDTEITVLDRSTFPAPDASSIDTSRIIRSDYANIMYARLAMPAQEKWRHDWWGKDVYHEPGLALVMNATEQGEEKVAAEAGQSYTERSLENGRRLGLKVGTKADGGDLQVLNDQSEIESIFNQPADSSMLKGGGGDSGYVNWRGGWADAEGGMRNLLERLKALNRVKFLKGEVQRLLFSSTGPNSYTVSGATLKTGDRVTADLTILATGAWTPALLDLRGIASSTGQILAYTPITSEEQAALAGNPTILNESSGLFIIPPSRHLLKVACHGYGYSNPTTTPYPEPTTTTQPPSQSTHSPETNGPTNTTTNDDDDRQSHDTFTVSLPVTSYSNPDLTIPLPAQRQLRSYLATTIPSLADRPFSHTRLCWYTDTHTGDFIISYHPAYSSAHDMRGLFVATGGSGHGYKFLPVIGDKIVEALLGTLDGTYADKWRWPSKRAQEDHVWTGDWRGGEKGLVLGDELKKE